MCRWIGIAVDVMSRTPLRTLALRKIQLFSNDCRVMSATATPTRLLCPQAEHHALLEDDLEALANRTNDA